MPALLSTGRCNLCGGTFGRAVMSRHLKGCKPHETGRTAPSFHIFIGGRYSKDYWLHVMLPVRAPLSSLDSFLREIWLECCGHLSAFTVDGERYAASPMGDLNEASMRVPAGRVLDSGAKFFYEYDYGSTTELALKVVGVREWPARRGAVQLLARNDPPPVACDECGTGALATQICTQCACQGGGWLCDDCAKNHECGDEMFLPVVNSPRAGVCGYAG